MSPKLAAPVKSLDGLRAIRKYDFVRQVNLVDFGCLSSPCLSSRKCTKSIDLTLQHVSDSFLSKRAYRGIALCLVSLGF